MAVKSSYGAAEREIGELFADYLEGGGKNPAVALGARPLSPEARNAIDKSLEAFGYPQRACTYASLTPVDDTAEGSDLALDAHALFLLVEGLDPLFVIAADSASVAALGQAYRTSFPLDAPIRVFGRPSAAFSNLDTLLETPQGKQKAWRIMKSLQA